MGNVNNNLIKMKIPVKYNSTIFYKKCSLKKMSYPHTNFRVVHCTPIFHTYCKFSSNFLTQGF